MSFTSRLRVAVIVTAACGSSAWTQTDAFEAVSIKPAAPGFNLSRTGFDPDRLFGYGVNLKQLIEWAYDVTDAQISGGPSWMDSKYFDVEAKAEGRHTREELLRMLKPTLADRFKLMLHRETKEVTAYILTAGNNRSELREPKGGPSNIQIQPVPGNTSKEMIVQVIGQSVSMRYLTGYLTSTLGRLVVDQTNLTNSFDFKVETTLDVNEFADKREALSTVLSSVMPKLGLKLDSRKQVVEVLVVDGAAEPSPN
jgi:uncharacterized protein (TIGR03435 family)